MKLVVLTVAGTRPQFVKEAALSPHLRRSFREVFVNTGQHYDIELCREQFDALDIPEPDYDLEVGSDTHAKQTAAMMSGLEDVFLEENPDVVILYGDTNSTLAGALAASKMKIPIAHVEAGPRQHDMSIPEEINRVVTDRLSSLLLAPDRVSVENLANEGIVRGVRLTGDVMYDIFLEAERELERDGKGVDEFGVRTGEYVLLTLHRPHNSDNRESLESILGGVKSTGEKVVFPVHPRTRKNLDRMNMAGELERDPDFITMKPVHYMDMVLLMKNARVIVTDSGGVNKEAYFCGVPCISVDFVSGWPQIGEAGWCVCTGADEKKISEALKTFSPQGPRPAFFGEGDACEKIVCAIEEGFG